MTILEAVARPRRLGRADPRHGSRLGGPRAGPPRHLSPSGRPTVAPERLQRFFIERQEARRDLRQVAPEVAALVTFKQLNLIHALPMRGPLDAIFCRNVVIYFDKETQRELFARIARLQRPGDLLFLGHSESLFKVCDSYALIGKTIYRRA